MNSIWSELSYTIRNLCKNPLFCFVIVGTLAVSIGGAVTVYSVLYAAVFPSYSYNHVDRLVSVRQTNYQGATIRPSIIDFIKWKDDERFWDELSASKQVSFVWTGMGDPERLKGYAITANTFRMAGIQPFLGRDFSSDEDSSGKTKVAILGYNFWRTRFNADENILGKNIILDKQHFFIIGVMSADKGFPDNDINIWVPWVLDEDTNRLASRWTNVEAVGRLNDGLSLEVAQKLSEGGNTPYQFRRYATEGSRVDKSNIWLLLGAVMVLLVIACVGIAGLMLARGLAKTKEITLRSALGATRAQIVRYMLWEPLLLALAGGVIGIFISIFGVKIFYALKPVERFKSGILESDMNTSTLLFAGIITIGCVLIFGLIPAFRNSKVNLLDVLKETGSENSIRKVIRARSLLVIFGIAMAVMLLAGSSVLVKSFQNRMNIDLGVRWDEKLMTLYVTNPDFAKRVSNPELLKNAAERKINRNNSVFIDELLLQLKQNPAISSAAASSIFPFGDIYTVTALQNGADNWLSVQVNHVTSDFFEVAGVPLKGNTFNDIKVEQTAVVSALLAQKLWPEEEAIGKFIFSDGNPAPFEVTGVCGEVRYSGIMNEPEPTLYLQINTGTPMPNIIFLVRTKGNPRDVIPFARQTLAAMAPDLPIDRIHTKNEMLSEHSIARARFYMGCFLFFAFLALVMAVSGIYGLVHYIAMQQRWNIGIRMAMGATSKNILIMMFGRGIVLIIVGIILGLVLFMTFNRILNSYLFGVSPTDVATLIIISVFVLAVTSAAILIPSIKAMRTNPAALLKKE